MSVLSTSSSARDLLPDFGVRPRWRSARTVLLEVVGEVDISTAPSLLAAVEDELAVGCRALVLDLAGVSFCSARCVGTLVEIRRLADARGATVCFPHPSPAVRRIADLTQARGVVDGDPTLASSWTRGRC